MFNKKKVNKKIKNTDRSVKQPINNQEIDKRSENVVHSSKEKERPTIISYLDKMLLSYSCEEDHNYEAYLSRNCDANISPIISQLDINTSVMIEKMLSSVNNIISKANTPLDFVDIEPTYEGVANNTNDVEVTIL